MDAHDEVTQILVRRPGGIYRDGARRYVVLVDGVERGKIGDGETLQVRVTPGSHRVRARIDWTGSPEIDVRCGPGETLELQVEPAGNAFAFLQGLTRKGYLKLQQV